MVDTKEGVLLTYRTGNMYLCEILKSMQALSSYQTNCEALLSDQSLSENVFNRPVFHGNNLQLAGKPVPTRALLKNQYK